MSKTMMAVTWSVVALLAKSAAAQTAPQHTLSPVPRVAPAGISAVKTRSKVALTTRMLAPRPPVATTTVIVDGKPRAARHLKTTE